MIERGNKEEGSLRARRLKVYLPQAVSMCNRGKCVRHRGKSLIGAFVMLDRLNSLLEKK